MAVTCSVDRCPACQGTDLREIYRLEAIPVQSCILLDTDAEARDFPRAPLRLMFCDGCGFIFNSEFDMAKVDYASATEESQHFSATFNQFAVDLVGEIASLYDLSGKTTLEIGCGKGEFLAELVRQTGTVGIGVDPGFIPDDTRNVVDGELTFIRDYFDPAAIEAKADFVACRHTLEHVPEVDTFIADIAKVTDPAGSGILFFETPDVRRILEEGAFWDVYYEHCSYFTLGSHARLLRRHGFDVTKLYVSYGDQYLILYAEPSTTHRISEAEDDLGAVRALAAGFPKRVSEIRGRWADFALSRHADGKSIAIWGGGSKCVAFLTSIELTNEVSRVVDINPFKQGKFLPGTGHRVESPVALAEDAPDVVIVMNPVYLKEIGEQLGSMGLSPELVAL